LKFHSPHGGRQRLVNSLCRSRRTLVFIPTGSAILTISADMQGTHWANSVLLESVTGEFVWGFQVVHHDLWDTTSLTADSVHLEGQNSRHRYTTKMGRVFVLNRA